AELTRFDSKNLRRVLAALGKSGTGIPFKGHYVTGCQRLLQAGFALLQRKFRLSTFGDVDHHPREPPWLSLAVIETLAARDYPAHASVLLNHATALGIFLSRCNRVLDRRLQTPDILGMHSLEKKRKGSAFLTFFRIDRAQRGELRVAIDGVRGNAPVPCSNHPCRIERTTQPVPAFAQRLLRQMTLNRQRHGVCDESNRIQVLLGRASWLVIVNSEGTEDAPVHRLDGRGPAGSQPVGLCEISVVDPKRIVGDVRDDYRLATKRGRAARPGSWTNGSPVDGIAVGLGQARCGPVQKVFAVFVQYEDRGHHLDIGPLFYGAQQFIQDVRKRSAGRNLGKHAPFGFDLFMQSLFRVLVLGDVAGDAEQSHRHILATAHNRALKCNPAKLTGIRVARRMHHPVFGVPYAATALCLCKCSVYKHAVIRMNEASPLLEGLGRLVVSMNLSSPRIALETTRVEVHAKRPKLGAAEGQLEAFVAYPEYRFIPAPLREQRGEDQNQERCSKHEGLSGEDAVRKVGACVSEVPEAEGYRPDDNQGHDKRCGRCEHRPTTYCNPQENGEHQGHGQGRRPRRLWQGRDKYAQHDQRRERHGAFDQLVARQSFALGLAQSNQKRRDRDNAQRA